MKRFLLLNGSVRKQGTSASIIEYMTERLLEKEKTVRVISLIDVFDQKVTLQELLRQIKEAECIGIISCCYVNTLAYPTIAVLEQLAEQGREAFMGKRYLLLLMVGCRI